MKNVLWQSLLLLCSAAYAYGINYPLSVTVELKNAAGQKELLEISGADLQKLYAHDYPGVLNGLFEEIQSRIDPQQPLEEHIPLAISKRQLEDLLALTKAAPNLPNEPISVERIEAVLWAADYLLINPSNLFPLLKTSSVYDLCHMYHNLPHFGYLHMLLSHALKIKQKEFPWHGHPTPLVLEKHDIPERGGIHVGVSSMAITPHGKRIVIGYYDATLLVVDQNEQGQWLEPQALVGHLEDICSVAITADGSRIVSSSFDGTIKIWDLKNEQWQLSKNIQVYERTDRVVNRFIPVTITADGRYVIGSKWDGIIRIWQENNTGIWQLHQELEGHTDGVWSISATPDGKRFVSGSLDKTIRIWDRNDSGIWQQSGEFLRADGVWSVAISQDGTRIVSSGDHIVMVYDQDINTHTWDSSQLWKGGEYAMVNEPEVAMTYDGKLIVSGANNSLIFVWNKNSNGQWKHNKPSLLRGNKLAIAADEQRIVCSSDGEITVWDREPIDEFCQRQNRLKVIEHLERVLLPSWVFDKP